MTHTHIQTDRQAKKPSLNPKILWFKENIINFACCNIISRTDKVLSVDVSDMYLNIISDNLWKCNIQIENRQTVMIRYRDAIASENMCGNGRPV